jgi:hypothetical protein
MKLSKMKILKNVLCIIAYVSISKQAVTCKSPLEGGPGGKTFDS